MAAIEAKLDTFVHDVDGRKMIQLFAQLSIIEGEGIPPGRFQP